MTHLLRYAGTDHTCSCGAQMNRCTVWSGLAERTESTRPVATWVESGLLTLLPPIALTWLARRTGFTSEWSRVRSLLDDGGIDVVVDSSKTCWPTAARPLLLRAAGFHVVPVFLWRHPKDAVPRQQRARKRRTTGKRGEQIDHAELFPRTLLSWLLASTFGLVVMRRLGGSMYLRYEDIVGSPGEHLLAEIGLAANGGTHDVHMCSGNRMVYRPLTIEPAASADTEAVSVHGAYEAIERIFRRLVMSEKSRAGRRRG